jgi:hypothetical protein
VLGGHVEELPDLLRLPGPERLSGDRGSASRVAGLSLDAILLCRGPQRALDNRDDAPHRDRSAAYLEQLVDEGVDVVADADAAVR